MSAARPLIGLVLAGGRGSRMGGEVLKPLVLLNGRTLAQHVIDRFGKQTDELILSGPSDHRLLALGLPTVSDIGGPYDGPLVGITSGMRYLLDRFGSQPFDLVTAAADTPFLPIDLVGRLSFGDAKAVRVASHRGNWAPTFALWPSEVASRLLTPRHRSIRSAVEDGALEIVDFPATPDAPKGDPFFNINTPSDLATAVLHDRGS